MEGLDALVIDVDEGEIVELLQQEMRGIVIDVAALVAADRFEEQLEGGAVENILAGMELIAEIDAILVIDVEDRLPAPAKLGEGFLDQPGRTLRPGIKIGESQSAGEGDGGFQAKALRGGGGKPHLLDRPFLPRLRLAVQGGRSETVELAVIGRVRGDELPLQMGGEFGDLDAGVGAHALDLVAIGLGGSSPGEIEQARVPSRDLDALVTEAGGPFGDRAQ